MAAKLTAFLVLAVALAGCAVPRPVSEPAVPAPDDAQIREIVTEHRAVYEIAREADEPRVAALVETGIALEVTESASRWNDLGGEVDIVETFRPSFTEYPMWFGAVVESGERRDVEIYERAEAKERWRLAARVPMTDDWPEVERDGGLVAVLDPADAEDAAAKLAGAGTIESAAPPELDQVTIEQLWHVEAVPAVMELADGGALAIATLRRTDHVTVDVGLTVTWPSGSVMHDRWPNGLSGFDTLETVHVWAIRLPESGEPEVLDHSGWSGASR